MLHLTQGDHFKLSLGKFKSPRVSAATDTDSFVEYMLSEDTGYRFNNDTRFTLLQNETMPIAPEDSNTTTINALQMRRIIRDTACAPIRQNVTGSVVLVRRGSCTFSAKARRLQEAGALGMVIYDPAEPLSGVEVGLKQADTVGIPVGSMVGPGIYQVIETLLAHGDEPVVGQFTGGPMEVTSGGKASE